MTKNWKIAEKVIGGFQIIWGICILILSIWSVKILLDSQLIHLGYNWKDLSAIKIIRDYHYQFLLPLLTIFSGLALLFAKKSGWLLGIVTSALSGISMILVLTKIEARDLENEILLYTATGLLVLIFTIMLGLLLSKPIRSKYNPSKKTWLIVGVLFTLMLLDWFLMN